MKKTVMRTAGIIAAIILSIFGVFTMVQSKSANADGTVVSQTFDSEKELYETMDVYSSQTSSHAYIVDGKISVPSSAAFKLMSKEDTADTFTAEVDIAPSTIGGAINSGIYFYADDYSAVTDAIDAFNIHIERKSGATNYSVAIFEFTDSKYVPAHTSRSIPQRMPENDTIHLKVSCDGERVDVYVNNENIPLMTKRLATMVEKTGRGIGLRSHFSDTLFDNFTVTNTPSPCTKKTIKVLSVGNSLTQDSHTYIHSFGVADDVNVLTGCMYYPGCPLSKQVEFMKSGAAVYTYYKNGGVFGNNVTFDYMLKDEDWDIITFNCGADRGFGFGYEEWYFPALNELLPYIRSVHPNAEFGIMDMIASPMYAKGVNDGAFAVYNYDQQFMYEHIKENVPKIAAKANINYVIPTNEAFHLVRQTPIASNEETNLDNDMHRDTIHPNEKGRYLLGAVWYGFVTGYNVIGNTFRPAGFSYDEAHGAPTEYEIAVMQDCAQRAVMSRTGFNRFAGDERIKSVEVESAKTEYTAGEVFDYGTAVVNAAYYDGTVRQIKYFTIDKLRPLTADDKTVTISYRGFNIVVNINVNKA